MHTRNFNFSKIFTKSLWEKSFDLLKRLSAKEGCLPANTVEKFININGVPHEHEKTA
jgi:hypothetical protein